MIRYHADMQILFITRKFPPSIGGMEQYSMGFYEAFQQQCKLIALKKTSQTHLLWWLPYAFFKGIWQARQADVIHIGDGVLAWLGVILHWCTGKPITIALHGLDVTYKKYGYQKLIWSALRYYQAHICVSDYTARLLKQHGFENTVHVIRNAIRMQYTLRPRSQTIIKKYFPNIESNTIVLLTVGRLVKRKGVAWFAENVMPKLGPEYKYIITSKGPEQSVIEDSILKHKLQSRVKLIGEVSDDMIQQLYAASDVFVMPNISVENDSEGFGIVAIESAVAGLPILAANLEGIRDAVVDEETGFLLPSGNVEAWIQAICGSEQRFLKLSRSRISHVAQEQFSWEHATQSYSALFKKLTLSSYGESGTQ